MFDELMKEALELERHLETEWAEENASLYDLFADRIELERLAGRITDEQFNQLASIAFYDYADIKEEE